MPAGCSRLFNCAGSIIAMKGPDGAIKAASTWPDNFVLTGNQISGAIYLRNLLERFPAGNCIIPNIHKDDRCWSWPDAKVRSLLMAPVQERGEVRALSSQSARPRDIYQYSCEPSGHVVAAPDLDDP